MFRRFLYKPHNIRGVLSTRILCNCTCTNQKLLYFHQRLPPSVHQRLTTLNISIIT